MKHLFSFAMSICFFALCFSQQETTAYYSSYNLELVRVKNLKLDTTLKKSSENIFEDNAMSFSLKSSSETICAFSVNNKTNSSCKINWDSASYTDILGDDLGVTFITNAANQNQIQSEISPKSEITPLIVPEGYASFINGKWEPTPTLFNTQQAAMAYQKYGNKNISIIIPIEIQGEVTDYLLDFTIINYAIKEDVRITGMDNYRNENLVYNGRGYFSIGDETYRYNKRDFHNLMYSTGNPYVVSELRKANHKRITSNVLRPIGIVVLGYGILFYAIEGDDAPGLIAVPAAGAGLIIASVSLRVSFNEKLKLVPTFYKPVR